MKKNYRLTNACLSISLRYFPNWSDRDFYRFLAGLPYLRAGYFIFQRELSEAKKEHWQCYLEFSQQVYASVLHHDFKAAHFERRKEGQLQAVKYCQKEESRLSGPYQRGQLKAGSRQQKRQRAARSREEELEYSQNHWLNVIIKKMKGGAFREFAAIEEENPVLFWKNQNLLKNIWNEIHPIQQLDVKPARVIWCYGASGAGKSIWTKKQLRAEQWQNEQIITIVPQNLSGNDKLYFNLSHEAKKVLVINEVDKDFPKHNNLIAFIDRNSLLMTRNSQIRNNFELIIINSLYHPTEVFGYLEANTAQQVLRRIFNPLLGCRVYQIRKNSEQLAMVLREKLFFTDTQFQDWYRPAVQEIKEVDYQLLQEA